MQLRRPFHPPSERLERLGLPRAEEARAPAAPSLVILAVGFRVFGPSFREAPGAQM